MSPRDADAIPEEERHRVILAAALGLTPEHVSVTAWHKTHGALVDATHYRPQSPAPGEALSAFLRLKEILWGRLGPFYDVHKDLAPLLATAEPTPEHLKTLHGLLVRPGHRVDFFTQLEHPGWVEPLRAAGVFRHPPPARNAGDGRWTWDPWPEGDYLRRMATHIPGLVTQVLQELPPTNNPTVWHRAAEAAIELPVESAASLVRRFCRVVRDHPFLVIFVGALGRLALRLADAGHRRAFDLGYTLLRVQEAPAQTRPSIFRWSATGKLARVSLFNEYELSEWLPPFVAALEQFDAEQALQLLSHRLKEVMEIEVGRPADGDREDMSTRWCHDLADADDVDRDARQVLAVATAALAARWATTSPENAHRVIEILGTHPWGVFHRLKLHVLAHAGHQLPELLDEVVGDVSAVADDAATPEYRLVLERQFQTASPEVQARHVEAVLRGPGTEDELRTTLGNLDDSPLTDGDIERYIVRWQRKRLRRFGASAPRTLQPLADTLANHPRVPPPTTDDILLEDQGGFGRVFSRSGPSSPLSEAEILARSPGELVGFFRTFEPVGRGWDQPTPAGLARALAAAVATDPQRGSDLARLLPEASPQPTYVRGVLEGLVRAAEADLPVPMTELLPVIHWTALQPRGPDAARPVDFDYADANWDEAKRQAARLLLTGAQKKLLAAADRDAAWQAAEAFVANAATWEGSAKTRDEPVETVDAALMVALNHLGGDAVRALVEVALWTYRLDEEHFDPARLRVGLDGVLSRTGRESIGARTMLGKYLPWLLLIDQEGVLARAPQLFAGGFAPPPTNPVWGGYLTNQRFFNGTFTALRPWYIAAAEALPADRSGGAEPDRTWSPTRHLVSHATIAMLQRLVAPGDADGFLPRVFGRAPVSDLAHVYWEVFRAWSDRKEAPHRAAVEQLLTLWTWRLEALDAMPESTARQEESGALGWFSVIPWLADEEVLPLLGRTAVLAKGEFAMDHAIWPRLDAVTALDAPTGFGIAERIVNAVLASEYPYFDAEKITPVLRRALAAQDGETRHRARDLVHLLGERGFQQFRRLLDEASDS